MSKLLELVFKYYWVSMAFVVGAFWLPLGLGREFITGAQFYFEHLGSLLTGAAAVYAAWWAKRTFGYEYKANHAEEAFISIIEYRNSLQRILTKDFYELEGLYLKVKEDANSIKLKVQILEKIVEIQKEHREARSNVEKLESKIHLDDETLLSISLLVDYFNNSINNSYVMTSEDIESKFKPIKENLKSLI
jgi:hypothetical protein